MRHFNEIFQIAADRKGGETALEEMLEPPLSETDLARIPDDRWLSTMAKCIFQSGFNWKVIENKWPGFEAAFNGFDVGGCAMMDDAIFDALLTDTRIVRHGTKIASVRDNAVFLLSLRDRGGAGAVLGGWPAEDYIGLLDLLKSRGARLGGNTGQYAMRFMRRDGFILSADVTARLVAEGVINGPATLKSALRAVQEAFNTWRAQSGRSLTEISRVLAMSI